MMRQFANFRDAFGATVLGGLLVAVGGCSGATSEDAGSSSLDEDGESPEGAGSTGYDADPDGLTSAAGGSSGHGGDNAVGTDDEGGSTSGASADSGPSPKAGPHPTCPDELPEGWIFCEDFEGVYDPSLVFFDYVDAEGNFAPTDEGGASGVGSMKAHYREGVEGAGFMSVSFGSNPINTADRPGYRDDDNFDEVYWRFRVKMQPGWPDAGPYNLSRISAFAQSDWGEALVASVGSDDADVTLRASASSCVHNNEVECEGIDADALVPLGTLSGTTPVFSAARAGQWQCVEAHVKLNTPGQEDGVFEFWVDGELEASRAGMDWRGTWAAFGLNLLSIENFWLGGAPADLDRWFDDMVISTGPIGCE
ncbi:MAG: hypothetical protein KUG77_16595 [Nannocystaceae bacterium]|nr:hypothetical protein [Nannocystaceae bacterium]